MNLAYGQRRRLRHGVCVFAAALVIASGVGSSEAVPPRLKIKNGQNLTVALGKSRERAFGIRPDKETWTVVLTPDLAGCSAELKDVTPNVTIVRWTVPVTTDGLVLDQERFLPSHVYRLEIWREKQLLGAAFVYLYPPPPPPSVNHVELGGDDKDKDQQKSNSPSPIPKGGL